MKKFLAKLGIFVALSTMLAMATAPAYAEEETPDIGAKIKAFYEQFDSNQCIDKTIQEKGYVVTIVEEPFGDIKEFNNGKEGNAHYEEKKCTRNVWFAKEGNPAVMSQLLKDCSEGTGAAEVYGSEPVHTCQEVMVMISGGGTTLISNYVGTIYRWAASLVGIICVLVIVLSGIQLAASGGDSSGTEGAKKRIVQSLSGLAVLFLSGLILYTINPNFFTATP
ncbi:MAG: hypothetical protein WC873_00635 [Candidatus Gracilibacteria bacterium]